MLSSGEKLPFYEALAGKLEPGKVAKAQAGQGQAVWGEAAYLAEFRMNSLASGARTNNELTQLQVTQPKSSSSLDAGSRTTSIVITMCPKGWLASNIAA